MIDGAALFAENGVVSNLRYRVECGADWSTRHADVTGWIGERDVRLIMTRRRNGWDVDGVPVEAADFASLLDVDLGFTPATNTNAIRRLSLGVGAEAETTALWFDLDNWCVKPLRQVYRRLGVDLYEYASPDHDYRVVLKVNGHGLVVNYPKLWTAQATGD